MCGVQKKHLSWRGGLGLQGSQREKMEMDSAIDFDDIKHNTLKAVSKITEEELAYQNLIV